MKSEKEKVFKLLDENLDEHEFTIKNFKFLAKAPSLIEEAKIPLRMLTITKTVLLKDNELLEEVKLAVEEDIDLNKRDDLNKVYLVLPNAMQELISALAYLDTVVTKIYFDDQEITQKPSSLFLENKFLGLHVSDILLLVQNIFTWFEKEYDVDPFLSKKS